VIRYLALALLAAAIGAAAAYYLRAETGYVLVSYGPWILETSVLGFLLTVIATLLSLYYGARLLGALLRLPATVRQALAQRRTRRAHQSFEAGLGRLLAGDWAQAEIDLVRRAADHPSPALNYALAARAAQRAGAPERRDHYLELAARGGEADAVTANLVRAELLLERGAAAQALPILEQLAAASAPPPYAIELLADAYAQAQDWDALRRLLAGPRAPASPRHRELFARALRESLARAAAGDRLEALKSLWQEAPGPLREDAGVRRAYLRGLARFGADAEAAAQATRMLAQAWDPELVDLYGGLAGLDPVAQLATVEQWLNQEGEKAELLLAAGRVCIRNQLWGKARSYLDAALRVQPSPDAYLALARLCEQTRKPEEAVLFYRRGLELAASAAGQVSKA
jgi:HemY protein